MISTDTFERPQLQAHRAFGAFTDAAIARHKATLRNLIDQAINAGLVALIGCSIAAALVIGAPMPAGDSQTAMPMPESRSLFDQRVFLASSHEPRLQRLVGTVNAPIGQGWSSLIKSVSYND
jgi:hypothetical protein